ncbi:protein WVD2-like 1 [Quillaja saponaria]|uniref:Protein WVD2-like 1 n=1 Tax=Quillaja saponaria TaxID=32244 RepID=A0AAD7Q267_QUISA|nr:protein WVD2-like 1 [Quillaja saponaria]
MGREITGVRVEKKPSVKIVASNGSSNDKVHVSPRISEGKVEAKNHEVKEYTEGDSVVEKCHGSNDVFGVKSTNHDAQLSEEENEKHDAQKSGDNKKLSSAASRSDAIGNERANYTVPQPFDLATEKRGACIHTAGTESAATGVNSAPNAYNMHSPNSAKNLQPNSPFSSRKSLQPDNKKHHEDEDNWSVASSATSVRTSKYKVTVGTAPTFRSSERAEKRKEFYQKLEEKHRALEEERSQYEARQKEEQETALKQLRKQLVIKANPVPSFYYEGPPPKTELKKLPLTRPKSPKLSRRKSCSDAVNSSQEEKGSLCTRARQSLGILKEGSATPITPKNKDQTGGSNSNGTFKIKDRSKLDKETTKRGLPKITDQTNADIAVQS